MLSVYIERHTKAVPRNQFPVTFMNKNLIHLPLRTFIKADKRPIIKLSTYRLNNGPSPKCRLKGRAPCSVCFETEPDWIEKLSLIVLA